MRRKGFKFTFRSPWQRAAIGSLAITLFSTLALWWSTTNDSDLARVLNIVGVTGLTVGLVQIVMDLFVKQSMADEVIRAVGIRDRVNSVGIQDIQAAERFNWEHVIGIASEVHAHIPDSQFFLTQVWPHILRRAGERALSIDLIFSESPAAGVDVPSIAEKDWKARSARLNAKSNIRVRQVAARGRYGYLRTSTHLAIILEPVSEGVGFPSHIIHLYSTSGTEEAISLFGEPIQDFEEKCAREAGPRYDNVVKQDPEQVPLIAEAGSQFDPALEALDVPLDKKD